MRRHVNRGARVFSRASLEPEDWELDTGVGSTTTSGAGWLGVRALTDADVDEEADDEEVEGVELGPARPHTGLAGRLLTGLECGDARLVVLGLLLGVDEGVEIGEGPRDLEGASGLAEEGEYQEDVDVDVGVGLA